MKRLSTLLLSITLLSCGDKRTQEPNGAVSYESKEVNFKSLNGDVTLSGTLTTPTTDNLKTAVVLISGSGPDDRDYKNHFGHKPFLVLSHYLTQKGITVLRYDERGVGRSEGNYRQATYEDLVADVAGGINYLRELGIQKVGLIGHSEGGGVAPIVSLQAKTDFLILMAAANATANESLVYQTRARLKDMDVNEKTSEEIIVTLDSLLAIAKSEPDALRAKMKMDDLIARTDQTASEDYKTTAQRLGDVNWLIDGFLDPKFRYRLRNDPKDEFKKVRIPVLVLYGDGDKLVDVGTNLPLIKTAFDSTACDIKVFPGLGHLFMNGNVSMEELHEIEETIDPQVLATISDWILR
jgi:uncharacterized protein